MPLARAAASPPLEPPGVRSASQGLSVAPQRLLSLYQRMPRSGMLVRPITIAPASRSRSTAGASRSAYACARLGMPFVVADPATSMFSLMVQGTPCSGPSVSRRATASSARSAAASA